MRRRTRGKWIHGAPGGGRHPVGAGWRGGELFDRIRLSFTEPAALVPDDRDAPGRRPAEGRGGHASGHHRAKARARGAARHQPPARQHRREHPDGGAAQVGAGRLPHPDVEQGGRSDVWAAARSRHRPQCPRPLVGTGREPDARRRSGRGSPRGASRTFPIARSGPKIAASSTCTCAKSGWSVPMERFRICW